ncbi:unnamed protein product [Musa acuminata subsp. malaccensis]|uniref:(wild Malaysian banana) hypothetical protein n=1 Tax=Musa acuminata subsp. malaccensis TaxID=214687 RepID=A0A804JI79_MUSAM|nr:unnamed protein product [Musa acuminata subsp. malaccensis]
MSNKRRVSVRKWKAVAVVYFRELYFKKGKPHPGMKGISLSADQVLVTTLLWWCFSSYHGFTFWIILQWFVKLSHLRSSMITFSLFIFMPF